MDPEKWQILAVAIDTDGHFAISVSDRPYKKHPIQFNFSVGFRQKKKFKVLIDRFVDSGFGRVYEFSGRDMLTWQTTGQDETLAFAKELQPYLFAKKEICGRFIEALEMWSSFGSFTSADKHSQRRPKEIILKLLDYAENLNDLSEGLKSKKHTKFEVMRQKIDEFYEDLPSLVPAKYTSVEYEGPSVSISLPYIAGIFDSSRFKKDEKGIKVIFKGPNSLPVLEAIRSKFGGNLTKVINGSYIWSLDFPEAENVLKVVGPYRHLE